MLQFSRAKAAAILLTVLVICSFGAPNFLSEETLKNWPAWAQRRLVLGPDIQGGESLLLEVDRNDLRAQVLSLFLNSHVRSALDEARIALARPSAVRGGSIEVRPREAHFQAGLAKLRELSQPFDGARPVEVVDAGSGLIRVTPTDAALAEYERRSTDQTVSILQRCMKELGVSGAYVWQEGAGRIGLQIPEIPVDLLVRTEPCK
jgi:preprotein translocase subunit SecD